MRRWRPIWRSGTTVPSCARAMGASAARLRELPSTCAEWRAGINRTNGSPLMLAVGDGGACVRLVGDGQWQSLSTGTSRGLKSVSFAPKTRTAWVVGDEGTILKTTDGG